MQADAADGTIIHGEQTPLCKHTHKISQEGRNRDLQMSLQNTDTVAYFRSQIAWGQAQMRTILTSTSVPL